ncbi:MAG: ferric reductase-like transmembrane domain-containing protein [Proteobacteria bacterium]|nr:ferric reductase-like transmembrane domain-containing protein [Pseudomonadota bacterium]
MRDVVRDVVRGVLVGLVGLGLLGAIASRAGWVAIALPRPDGVGPWLLSRATGVTAFVALSLDTILGLVMSTRAGERWIKRGHALELHRWLSPVTLALVAGHAIVLLADRYIRFDLIDVVVPFASPFRTGAVGIGVVAAYLAIVVHASFGLRRRLGPRTWRRLHYLAFVAFLASALHAILAGTDTSRPWLVGVYAMPLAIVGALVVARVVGHVRHAARPIASA